MSSRCSLPILCLLIASLLAGCSESSTASLAEAFPEADAIPGWKPAGDPTIFDSENLYDLVDGQADAFFAYGFEHVAVQNYKDAEDELLAVEVWRLATSADAHGLFTVSVAGSQTDIGNDGDTDPGRRLAFWQDRYFVHLRARQKLDEGVLPAFAEAVSDALPSGGDRHTLMNHLPADGLIQRSKIFFHEEISIQDQLWLGGGNPLGLSSNTDAVLAQYDTDSGTARLLLVQYPDANAASAALAAVQGSQPDDLVAVDVQHALLGAVFGDTDLVAAEKLLKTALSDVQENR